MTNNTIHREPRETWNVCMALVLAAAGLFMTLYSAAIITGLIVRWLAHPY